MHWVIVIHGLPPQLLLRTSDVLLIVPFRGSSELESFALATDFLAEGTLGPLESPSVFSTRCVEMEPGAVPCPAVLVLGDVVRKTDLHRLHLPGKLVQLLLQAVETLQLLCPLKFSLSSSG